MIMLNKNFTYNYTLLIEALLDRPAPEINERTGAKIYSLPPTSFSVDLSEGTMPLCGIRKTFPKTAAAEVAWFLSGSKDVSFIKKYAPIWDKFTEADGKTIEAAYGYRWRGHFERDQISKAVEALANNNSDRRVYISAWDPAKDGLGNPSKNVPCPVGFSLSIRDGKLNSALFIRSSDVFVGLPYDVMGHALLMDAIAASLKTLNKDNKEIPLGDMHITLAHPHLYDVHVDMATEALQGEWSDDTITLPKWPIKRIVNIPDAYVNLHAIKCEKLKQPKYHCRPEIVQ